MFIHICVDIMQDTVESLHQMEGMSSLISSSPPDTVDTTNIDAKLDDMVQRDDATYENELSERDIDEGWSSVSVLEYNLHSLDINNTIKEIVEEVEGMEEQIKESQAVLDKSVQLEMFIHSRYQRYRKLIQDQRNKIQYDHQQHLLDKQSNSSTTNIDDCGCINEGLLQPDKKSGCDVELGNQKTNNNNNNENENDFVPDENSIYIQRLKKLENDEKMLEGVRQQHLSLLTNCEQMRRNLHDLHKQKAVLIQQTNKYL